METIKDITQMLEFPQEVVEKLVKAEQEPDNQISESKIRSLTDTAVWEMTWKELKAELNPDENGFKMLLCMLRACAYSYEKYQKQGITEKIFLDTMKCFKRFIHEHKESYGKFGFDRDFWVGRQLSLQLFRLGELEYEKCMENDEKYISIHIPSDAVIDERNCQESLKLAGDFFKQYDPAYTDVPYHCESWLLSPVLKKLLPENSRILRFQKLFEIVNVDENADDYKEWVFKKREIEIEEMPENTSLQRKMKEYVFAGGKVGIGKGYLK